METHAQKIRKALEALGKAKPNQVVSWIEKNYHGETKPNAESFRGDLVGYSINHSSSKYYAGTNKFLWFIKAEKSYRLATPAEIADFKEKKLEARKEKLINEDEAFASRLNAWVKLLYHPNLDKKWASRPVICLASP